MQLFDAFIRFFLLDDDGKATPQNGVLPTEKHAVIPAVPGDLFRFLVPCADLGGVRPESTGVYIGEQKVGFIRRQEAETYSEIRLRVNSAVSEGDYKQFALLGEIPNPDHAVTNLALNRACLASSTLEVSNVGTYALTDGVLDNGFWTSNSDYFQAHDEWLIMPLAELSRINSLVFYARNSRDGYTHFPVSVRLEISTDGTNYSFVRQWLNLDQPSGLLAVTLQLPEAVDATHLKLTFSDMRLNTFDSSYRAQLAEWQVIGYPLSKPPTIEANLLGTFKKQLTNLGDYVREIRSFFESYVNTPVTVDEDGSELVIKMYHTDRFGLGNVRVGIGLGDVSESNTNEPRLSVRFKDTITQPAKTSYRVSVDLDIAEGNSYVLGEKNYTATRTDTASSILTALGVTGETIELPGGTTPVISASAGSVSVINRNRPAIQVLFVYSSGGSDNYKAVVSSSVQAGNTYQISVEGQTTRTYIAQPGDVAATVEAYFNANGGTSFSTPLGKVPIARADAGSQVIANVNSPAIRLTSRTEIPAQVLDRYDVFVGTSILPGNTFSLQQNSDAKRVVVASSGDTALSVAQGFGYDTNPFTLSIPTGSKLTGFAESGPRYNEANIADVEVLSGPILQRNLPYVAEIVVPTNQLEGVYSLDLKTDTLIAQSNYIDVRADDKNTALVRFADTGHTYGMRYEEMGLVQQIRLPIYVSPAKIRQTETLGQTPDGKMIRAETRSEAVHTLTTRALPSAFHKAMWTALKHRQLTIDGIHYQQQGEYSLSDWVGRKNKLIQGSAELIRLDSYRNNRFENKHLSTLTESMGYVLIENVDTPLGLSVYLQSDNIVGRVRAGSTVAPDVYQLQIRSGCEPLEVAVYVDNVLFVTSLLTASRLNRIDEYLILQASQSVRIVARPAASNVKTKTWLQHRTDSAYSDEYSNQFEP
ncbi:discoidin domain-containing protein [Spirosoma oryzicola]|uniref:discoidin domain-containing protein n=1 Tax=Spirosoma oryzicola TaxID=2898794 RepID=UPI001E467C02|nr:discoidin domain-containing protein [Spirosoma oryzicola]UHG93273.1 discoidin domain-containing protein [Spirosoma oryzicola]